MIHGVFPHLHRLFRAQKRRKEKNHIYFSTVVLPRQLFGGKRVANGVGYAILEKKRKGVAVWLSR
jgi:hypothetical protein